MTKVWKINLYFAGMGKLERNTPHFGVTKKIGGSYPFQVIRLNDETKVMQFQTLQEAEDVVKAMNFCVNYEVENITKMEAEIEKQSASSKNKSPEK